MLILMTRLTVAEARRVVDSEAPNSVRRRHLSQLMKTLRLIQVTQDDIDKAERNDRRSCMIARALSRTLPGSFPRVDKGWVASIEVCAKTYRPSKEIKELVTAFDRRGKVSPFTICFDPKLKIATLGPDLLFVPLWTLFKAKRPLGS
jgi:hypothetical protein